MASTIFSSEGALLFIMVATVALGFWLQRFKVFKTLGPALTVIVMGIVMSNLRIVPTSSPTYDAISSYCVPLSVSICLLSLDLKQMRKLSKEPIIALASAIFSVCVAALVFGILFANKIDEGWKVAGMFVGTYTGGSSNLTAIAVGLDASKNTIASANAADYVVGIPTLILMFATPALYKSSKWLKKLWPYDMSESELLGDGNHEELMASKEWSIQEIAWLLAIGFGTVWAATSISSMVFGEGFRSAGRILLITTFYITLFCFCVIACSILLHLLITRLLKVRFEYVLLSIVGCISDGPTAALIASSAQWKTLINIGLLMGVLAGALGNYVGIGVAYAIRAFIGA